jgi:hypothetical protein
MVIAGTVITTAPLQYTPLCLSCFLGVLGMTLNPVYTLLTPTLLPCLLNHPQAKFTSGPPLKVVCYWKLPWPPASVVFFSCSTWDSGGGDPIFQGSEPGAPGGEKEQPGIAGVLLLGQEAWEIRLWRFGV